MLYQENSSHERYFNPRKRVKSNAMRQEMKEIKLSPEPVKNTEKEESPKVIKTFT